MAMKHVVLTESMKVGHEQIDGGHAQIIGIVNRCVDMIVARTTAAAFHESLLGLKAALVHHIDEEEVIMRDLGYPDMQGEVKEHFDGLMRLDQLLDTCRDGVDLEALLGEVASLLLLIFIRSDMSFKSYLQSIGYRDEAPV